MSLPVGSDDSLFSKVLERDKSPGNAILCGKWGNMGSYSRACGRTTFYIVREISVGRAPSRAKLIHMIGILPRPFNQREKEGIILKLALSIQ